MFVMLLDGCNIDDAWRVPVVGVSTLLLPKESLLSVAAHADSGGAPGLPFPCSPATRSQPQPQRKRRRVAHVGTARARAAAPPTVNGGCRWTALRYIYGWIVAEAHHFLLDCNLANWRRDWCCRLL
jgi:hypothetical protein